MKPLKMARGRAAWRAGKVSERGLGKALAAAGGMLAVYGIGRILRGRRLSRDGKAAPGTGSAARPSVAAPDTEKLKARFHGLDEEKAHGRIPRELERDPKNIAQTIHPDILTG